MAVYVDRIEIYPDWMINIKARRYGKAWCHMYADSEDELDAFARRLRLPPTWKQKAETRRVHYDLVPRMREKALAKGALEDNEHKNMKRIMFDAEVK